MYSITRRFNFDAGHRVFKHESKCRNIHGHSYMAEISIAPRDGNLDSLGRVLDFSEVKKLVGGWLEKYIDHGMILFKEDSLVSEWPKGHKLYVMETNPTAENIAQHFFQVFQSLLGDSYNVVSVIIHETINCKAEYFQ